MINRPLSLTDKTSVIDISGMFPCAQIVIVPRERCFGGRIVLDEIFKPCRPMASGGVRIADHSVYFAQCFCRPKKATHMLPRHVRAQNRKLTAFSLESRLPVRGILDRVKEGNLLHFGDLVELVARPVIQLSSFFVRGLGVKNLCLVDMGQDGVRYVVIKWPDDYGICLDVVDESATFGLYDRVILHTPE